jgi:hypothetical protein
MIVAYFFISLFLLVIILPIIFYFDELKKNKLKYKNKMSFIYKKRYVILLFDLYNITYFEFVDFNGVEKWFAHTNDGKKYVLDGNYIDHLNLSHRPFGSNNFNELFLVDDLKHIPEIKIGNEFITFITNIQQENYTSKEKIFVKK